MKTCSSILIKNTLIVDGTGTKPYYGNILIESKKITKILVHNDTKNDLLDNIAEIADLIIEGAGLITAPGFIDVHSHNDLVPFMKEDLKHLKIFQGVTTELVGQCGLGAAPCSDDINPGWRDYIKGVVGEPNKNCDFKDFKSFIDKLSSSKLANNYAALISHGAIRASVIGFEGRVATDAEIKAMCVLIDDAMNSGAFGMSLGLQYMPGIFSSKNELIELCKVVALHDGIVMVHLRNHDISITNALDEMIEVAKVTGVKLHISHLRSYASETLGCRGNILCDKVNVARNNGISLTFDEHVYLSGSTLLTQLLPPWITAGGNDQMIKRLKKQPLLKKLHSELTDPNVHYNGWDNYSLMAGFENILITSINSLTNKVYVGRTIGDISFNLNIDPFNFFVKLLLEEGSGVGIVTLNVFSEEDLEALLLNPFQMIGSDSIPAGKPHPRLYGNYPLFIGKFVRERQLLTIEEAIRKATSLPAKTLGLNDRGILAVGMAADIVMFDLNEICGKENYFEPTLPPLGIHHVIVNGGLTLLDGKICRNSFGEVITLHTTSSLK